MDEGPGISRSDERAVPTPPWRTPPRAGRRRITRDEIIDAALTVLERDGADALTTRAVAQQMRTGPASLYAHVAGKDELLELLVDRVIGEMPEPPQPRPPVWADQLRQMCRDTRAALLVHPGIAAVALGTPPGGPHALHRTECLLAVLRAGGLPDRVAALALDLFSQYVVASAFEADLRRRASGAGPEWPAELERYFSSLSRDRFPHTVQLAAQLTRPAEDERFEFGLDVLIAGLHSLTDVPGLGDLTPGPG
ncbi:TetR/AcrR family transcriptional regulator [Pseudactinotalea sp. HY158]|uniref:TetR/AcrR family transcriptional regulator n=1 Tax=Pseudactinotalea sp. HY158 TaxID=2654547 RepID=UPI00129D0C04|nr:TetR/AcrR family transcriptional regulator [Pseudactinotalea sp. HY158]QGH69672.1 TetR family transcriptional regulator [Pseudactinotalea sp. HY158]